MNNKKCLRCRKVMIQRRGEGKPLFSKRKYCSPLCSNRSKDQRGNKNPDWKGDKVKYTGLHMWLQSNYGRGEECEICHIKGFYRILKSGIKRWSIEWANRTGIYDRDPKNWIKLCKSCHVLFDKIWKDRKRTKKGTFI